MQVMKKSFSHIIIIVYILLAVFITVCLLSYNDYNTTEFGNKTVVIVKNDKTGKYKKGDLLIVSSENTYKKGMQVFYYVSRGKSYYIQVGNVNDVNKDSVVVDNNVIDKKFLIGCDNDVKAIPFVGSVLALLESKWGYLGIIIFPVLGAFLYEVYSILKELRRVRQGYV